MPWPRVRGRAPVPEPREAAVRQRAPVVRAADWRCRVWVAQAAGRRRPPMAKTPHPLRAARSRKQVRLRQRGAPRSRVVRHRQVRRKVARRSPAALARPESHRSRAGLVRPVPHRSRKPRNPAPHHKRVPARSRVPRRRPVRHRVLPAALRRTDRRMAARRAPTAGRSPPIRPNPVYPVMHPPWAEHRAPVEHQARRAPPRAALRPRPGAGAVRVFRRRAREARHRHRVQEAGHRCRVPEARRRRRAQEAGHRRQVQEARHPPPAREAPHRFRVYRGIRASPVPRVSKAPAPRPRTTPAQAAPRRRTRPGCLRGYPITC